MLSPDVKSGYDGKEMIGMVRGNNSKSKSNSFSNPKIFNLALAKKFPGLMWKNHVSVANISNFIQLLILPCQGRKYFLCSQTLLGTSAYNTAPMKSYVVA